MASIPQAIDAATAKILADAAKVRAAAKNLADVAAATGKAVHQTNADLVAFVHRMDAMGIHTMALDASGKLIDQSGIFEQEMINMADQPLEWEQIDMSNQPFETGPGYDETIGGEPTAPSYTDTSPVPPSNPSTFTGGG